jgi:UDP-glucose 4-epimerase
MSESARFLKQETSKAKILIIGMGGGLAQLTARLLLNTFPQVEILGIDSRPLSVALSQPRLTCLSMKYSRGNFENLFRSHEFDYVLHLGRLTHSTEDADILAKRLDLAVMGTNKILDLVLKHKVKKLVVLSTFHVYGALPDNSLFLTEEAPLRASIKHPSLRDVVEMDQMVGQFMWRHQHEMSTILLRPCNIIGKKINNVMTKYLTTTWTPRPIDYNPMYQFIHEFDMAQSLMASLTQLPTGVYNIASQETLGLKEALASVGTQGFPVSLFMLDQLNSLLKNLRLNIPSYLIDYLRFSCLISPHAFLGHVGEDFFRFSIQESLALIKSND